METTTKTKRITLATVKSFIKKNQSHLYINVKSSFDGMTDCVQCSNGGFQKAVVDNDQHTQEHSLGIKGAWFVGRSRDYFTEYMEQGFIGIKVYNCCGSFILAYRS